MSRNFIAITLSALAASASISTLAAAAPNAQDVLEANKAASGGEAWDGKSALRIQYGYTGQGLTGKVISTNGLKSGRWLDDAEIGPATQVQGFDGSHTWAKDSSGTVTLQDGGDSRPLAVNEGYRRANLWWRAGFGGAIVVFDGEKTDGAATYDVLTVTPKGGKDFDAWFDAKTHLLSRIIEQQGPQTSTTTLSDYRAVNGVELPYKALISTGTTKYDQALAINSATFIAMPADSIFTMPENKVADFSIIGGAPETTVAFELINNHIYAPASVNGKQFTFIFDTGGVNLVTPPTAQLLGLKSQGAMQGSGAGEGHMDIALTKVDSLKVGDAVIRDQVFPVAPLNQMSNVEGVEQQGMVGFETFRRFVTRVDYGARKVTLIDPKHFDPKDAGAAIPFTFYGNGVVVSANFNGHPGNFTVDTGSRVSLTLNGPYAAKNGITAASAKSVSGVTGWGVGGPSHATVMRGGTFVIGPYTIQRPIAEIATDKGGSFADASLAGNIGAGLLKRYVVTLDYGHSVLYLKPITGQIADLDTFDHAGMWFNGDPSGFKVIDVMKGAPADQAGIQVGDTITAVDGQPASDIHLYDLRKRLRDEAAGAVVAFTVKRGDETKNITVALRDLI
ncbi:MAG TPA: aspartyl protease family protein [Rhizomicrobium sp.]|jgi:predicted aspartyl protease|nr:aspartyl protease family protein [Rhizomicrobium sp.]